jgi:hypothetical protein
LVLAVTSVLSIRQMRMLAEVESLEEVLAV